MESPLPLCLSTHTNLQLQLEAKKTEQWLVSRARTSYPRIKWKHCGFLMTPRAWTTQFSIYMRKIFQTKKVRPYLTNFDYVNVLKHSTQRKSHQPGFQDDRELNLEANALVEIGQNSDEWKDAMNKFVSAKMYNERLLDFVAYATTAPTTFTLENSLCA